MELKEEDLSDVQDELWDARIKWYNIGLRLGILAPDLDVIEKDGGDTEAWFRNMLRKWLCKGKNCTWEALIKTLSSPSVGQTMLAKRMHQKWCQKDKASAESKDEAILSSEVQRPENLSTEAILSPEVQMPENLSTEAILSPEVQLPENLSTETILSSEVQLPENLSTEEDLLTAEPHQVILETSNPIQEGVDANHTSINVSSPAPPQGGWGKTTEPEPTEDAPSGRELSLTKRYELRDYQNELAEPAIRGNNYILVAPTGSGKTLIASYIIMHHLKQMWEKGRRGKVAFVTPTRQLTFQQKVQLQKYVIGLVAVEITGASGNPMHPLIQSDQVDVIVCTAGKLRRELKTKCVQITDFSLIVADECHHAGRPSNYTDVMEFYIRQKLVSSASHLPQVVGMTASPGAGKGRGELSKVIDHQISLCATLNATSGITTVSRNIGELQKYHVTPLQCLEVRDERNPGEEFIRFMHSAMEQLEIIIGNVPGWTKGSPKYMSWLRNEKEAAERREENQTTKISVLDQLSVYSLSLITYHDFQYDDAIAVLDEVVEFPQKSPFEQRLTSVHRNLMDKLASLPKVQNPLLERMELILLEQYSRNPSSKGIFFVRAVKHTQYVTNWIQSSPKLSHVIKVAAISGSCGEMQKSEQIRVLGAFRKGTYNMMASTSVLEEGLDVPECNFVIRYQNISNDIAQVQAKGRARAENSRIYTVVSTDSNREYWYLVQEEKQHIARLAIAALPMNTLEQDVLQKQQFFIEEQNRKAQQKKALQRKWPCIEDVKILCKKCKVVACKGCEVFMYSINAYPHYVVPSKTFGGMYYKEEHNKPEISDGFVKPYHIYCRSENCRNQWGIIGEWRETGYQLPVLKCKQFLFKYKDETQTFRQWKDVCFEVQDILDCTEFEDDVTHQETR